MEKTCPCCSGQSLVTAKVAEYPMEVWYCQQCDGIWLSETQIQDLLQDPAKKLELPHRAQRGSRRCPECHKPMWTFHYPRTFVSVDVCKECHGIWLDHQEFQEIDTVRTAVLKAGVKGPRPEAAKGSLKAFLLEFIEDNLRLF